MRVAAIDCGTNSIRLLVAEVDDAGALVPVTRRTTIVRLGQDVDRTGRFADDALARTFAVCEEYGEIIAGLDVERTRFVATSATRDAANRGVFIDGVVARLGVRPEVVSGDEEARLSFLGATLGLDAVAAARPPYLVVDIGGGSTEFVLGGDGRIGDASTGDGLTAGGLTDGAVAATTDVVAACSVDIGSVRITERRLFDDPPTPDQIAAAVTDVDAAIAQAREVVDLHRAGSVIGVAGTVTTVAAGVLGLARYDRSAIHQAALTFDDMQKMTDALLSMPRVDRAALPYLAAGRVDVIAGGALIVKRVLASLPQLDTFIVSETDILDGIAAMLALAD